MTSSRQSKTSTPPTKKDVQMAAWQATVWAKLEGIEDKLEYIEDRVCAPDPEILHHAKRLDAISRVSFALVLAILGLVAGLTTTCIQHTERDAETRTRVEQHEKQLEGLQQAVSATNKARANDTARIVDAIDNLRDSHIVSESGVDCSNLTSSERHRLRAILQNPQLCAGAEGD